MKIERIKIEGYRSLKSVEWKPAPLNVLIGANASGKSNFLHALELLPAAAKGELEGTILDSGGMAPLLWDDNARRIRFELDTTEANSRFEYRLAFERFVPTGTLQIVEEQFIGDEGPVFDRRDKRWAQVLLDPRETLISRQASPPPDPGFPLRWLLSSWAIYHDLRTDQRAPVRQSALTRSVKHLEPDGQNLISLLFTLYSDELFAETIDKAMAAAFPGDYRKFKFVPLEDGRIWLKLSWKGSSYEPTAADLSDGTLRFLMLLAILANPEPPPLIAIDEPEAGLHPRLLPIIAELAAGAATRSQVILSTHSPEMLDAFRDQTPAVTVFRWVENRTEMKTLAGEELKRWVEDYSLGRFAFSGEAEAVPALAARVSGKT